jgi:endonuclease-8
MPEGDTLFRTASVLRDVLVGRPVVSARGRPGGPALGRLAATRIVGVDSVGKHLLIASDGGLTLHTHLGMHGSWHRYRTGEGWRRSPARAVAVIEVPGTTVVCFDAPTVELLDSRAIAIHPRLRELGPDLLAPDADLRLATARLRDPSLASVAIGDALLDQRSVAGLGNVYRSEVCFVERVDPRAPVGTLPDEALERLLTTGRRLLLANRDAADRTTRPDAMGSPPGAGIPRPRGERLWVYGRAGRPCRRCGTPIATGASGPLARRAYWCPVCQRGAGPPGQAMRGDAREEDPSRQT